MEFSTTVTINYFQTRGLAFGEITFINTCNFSFLDAVASLSTGLKVTHSVTNVKIYSKFMNLRYETYETYETYKTYKTLAQQINKQQGILQL